jgi:hypothetical protein
MPLRYELESQPETLSDFLLAADQKYLEGLELMAADRLGAGIYLMGFTAEMLLKAACFRFDGAGLGDEVADLLAPARDWLRSRLLRVDYESYHSLLFWCVLLQSKRSQSGRPLPLSLETELVGCVRRLYDTWWIDMRYRPDQATPVQAQNVYNDTTWIMDNYSSLWR